MNWLNKTIQTNTYKLHKKIPTLLQLFFCQYQLNQEEPRCCAQGRFSVRMLKVTPTFIFELSILNCEKKKKACHLII